MVDDSVLFQLNHYYGYWQPLIFEYEDGIKDSQRQIKKLIAQNIRDYKGIIPFLKGDFQTALQNIKYYQEDFKLLMKNTEFVNHGTKSIFLYRYQKNLHRRYQAHNALVRKLIEVELQR